MCLNVIKLKLTFENIGLLLNSFNLVLKDDIGKYEIND